MQDQNLEFTIKTFSELHLIELYDILKLRAEVFVVEQNCVYQDIDAKDQKSLHVIGKFDNKVVAYCRLFKPNDYFENASIGRVVVDANFRHKKWGFLLMTNAINAVNQHYNEIKITISAQLYLQNFYESLGFVRTSELYLEDGIEHIEMKIE